MQYDRLNKPLASDGWGEPCVAGAFNAAWDRELFGLEIPRWRSGIVQLVQLAREHFGIDRVRVADIGCGAALYARHLLESGVEFDYHGYDHNEDVLRAACRRWEFLPHRHVHLHLMDVGAVPWPIDDGAFDVVIWDTTLRFCRDVHAAFAESARIGGGWIVLGRTPIEERAWCERVHYYDMATPSPDWHFDHALLAEMAERNRLHLTTEVGCDDMHVFSHAPWPSAVTVPPSPRLARVFHRAFVRERVERLFDRSPGPWAVFGGGSHSRWLTTILPEALRKRIAAFIDDDAQAGASIDGIKVLRPQDVTPRRFAGVLVSSDTIEHTLYQRAAEWCAEPAQVHRLYDGLPVGPYDKAMPTELPKAGRPLRRVAAGA